MENKTTTAVVLKTSPVIVYDNIKTIGIEVEARLTALNIDNQVATVDTVKAIKTLRSTLNKEFKQYEDERKAVRDAISDPYNKFYDVYKNEIASRFNDADTKLKTLALQVDNKIKKEKEETVKNYYSELCSVKGIDFCSFEKVGLNITLSASLKGLKEKCKTFVDNIVNELELIDTQLFKDEIVIEYKKSLNVALSIKTVNARKEELKKIEEAKRVREEQARQREEQAKQRQEIEKKREEAKPITAQPEKIISPFEAPQVVEVEKLYTSSFSIKGTESEIRALRAHIEQNTNIVIL